MALHLLQSRLCTCCRRSSLKEKEQGCEAASTSSVTRVELSSRYVPSALGIAFFGSTLVAPLFRSTLSCQKLSKLVAITTSQSNTFGKVMLLIAFIFSLSPSVLSCLELSVSWLHWMTQYWPNQSSESPPQDTGSAGWFRCIFYYSCTAQEANQ